MRVCVCVYVCVCIHIHMYTNNWLISLSAPHVCDIQLDSCTVEWPMIKPMGQDPILYTVQIQRLSAREHEYKQVLCVFHNNNNTTTYNNIQNDIIIQDII